jgi:hypothetical protein
MVVLHIKPLQHDLPRPEHFLPALAQPNNLNIFISKVDIDWKSKVIPFFTMNYFIDTSCLNQSTIDDN